MYDLLTSMMKEWQVSQKQINDFTEYYNEEFEKYDNSVYSDILTKFVHLKNFLENSFWNNRFYWLFKYYQKYDTIIDLGFSIPYLPIYHYYIQGEKNQLPELLFVDEIQSKKFSLQIEQKLNFYATYIVGDLLDNHTWNELKSGVKSSKHLFVAFEVIEHMRNDNLFWKYLSEFKGSEIILSLPIGKRIPSHYISFDNTTQVLKYLSNYVDTLEYKVFESKKSSYKIFTCRGHIKTN